MDGVRQACNEYCMIMAKNTVVALKVSLAGGQILSSDTSKMTFEHFSPNQLIFSRKTRIEVFSKDPAEI